MESGYGGIAGPLILSAFAPATGPFVPLGAAVFIIGALAQGFAVNGCLIAMIEGAG